MSNALDVSWLIQKDRIHSDVYLDADIFEREIDILFSRHWISIGHEGEIPGHGDYRQRLIGRQPVIFLRDDSGTVRVLMNRCTHRGNAVCQNERGNSKGFTCSYHGWRFRLNGELATVPFPDRYGGDFDKSALHLRQPAQVASHRGFVFATLNPDEVPLTEWLGPRVLAELDDIADLSPLGELLVNAGVHRLKFRANWKLMIENAIDGYHAGSVHRSYNESIAARTGVNLASLATSSAPARIVDLGNGHCAWDSRALLAAGAKSLPTMQSKGDAARAYEAALIERHGKDRAAHLLSKSGSHLYIFPNFSYVGSHFRLFQPVSASETRVQLFPILLKGAPPDINARRLRMHEGFYGPAGIGGQSDDIEIFERNQLGLAARTDPWSIISRGIHLETRHDDGTVSGQITDELSNRTLWKRWRDLMTQPSEESAPCAR
ncbi:aromatic ring-hydroxylating oxygenase subunit alpha [Paraburkholderia phytofirmans]|uniref:aromatic ring-hydroxylating oxygenase subunit alpha n=1 Tax=Paraburkholderia phytofirmans TaxID=261302 RepID=UPI0038B897C4